jgi:hypothetical protein
MDDVRERRGEGANAVSGREKERKEGYEITGLYTFGTSAPSQIGHLVSCFKMRSTTTCS